MKISSARFARIRLLASLGISLVFITGCGGGSSSASPTPSVYIDFAASANGTSVVDANNHFVKFLTASRSMEVLPGITSDITLDASNNLVKGGNHNIGSVQLVAGSAGSSIAGLLAPNGTMMAAVTTGTSATLANTNTTFAAPGAAGSGGTTGSGGTAATGTLAACAGVVYPGDTTDPQTYSYDAIAQFDQCAYRATNDSKYVLDGNNQCTVLQGLIAATNSSFRPIFCSGNSLIK